MLFMSIPRFAVSYALILLAAIAVAADDSLWPGVEYDPSVPSFEDVLGHAVGERIVSHTDILEYLDALAEARPRQLQVFEYARSWEDRSLVYAVVGSEANMARLDQIRANRKRLADPRASSEDEARELIETEPAITWLAYGVHGNEISSPDAGLFTAYHLLAARDDEIADLILAESLIIIVPTQNPDGRDRFVHANRMSEGLEPMAHAVAAERDEPWPGGRTNHYYFDLNRDWLALTQPETRGHVAALLEWYPQIVVDLHEMSGDSTYYFAPEADPYNPHITQTQRRTLETYGRNNARRFDEFGFLYFTREVFDAFYPGYGASWPLFQGSIATTYEQASTRGLIYRRRDGTHLQFRQAVRHHFVASIATAETTARNRRRLLEDFWEYRKTAIAEGRSEPVRAYVLVNEGNTAAVRKLAGVLGEHGVEVSRSVEELEGCGRTFPAGSFAIDLAQPTKRLLRTILDPDVPMDEAFLEEQERRRQRDMPHQIYDVTGWSLPRMFGVESVGCEAVPRGALEPAGSERMAEGRSTRKRAELAYLVPWDSTAAARLLARALREGLRVLGSDRAFTQGGRVYPRGTLVFPLERNPATLHEALARLARETGAEVVATDSGWVEEGVNFGSSNMRHLHAPEVALAWDLPTRANSAGATRFVLEHQIGYPVTPVRTRRLAEIDLSDFDVLILPDGRYDSFLDEAAAEALRQWVQRGGTLIGSAGAVDFLSTSELLATDRENRPSSEAEGSEEAGGSVAGMLLQSEEDYRQAIEPKQKTPDQIPGVLVRARIDPDHWLTSGATAMVTALVEGNAIYTPLTLDKGRNPVVFVGAEDLVASGYLWQEARRQLAFKPLVMEQEHDRGRVIAFTADPTYRAYLDGLNMLLVNAIFRGPIQTEGYRSRRWVRSGVGQLTDHESSPVLDAH